MYNFRLRIRALVGVFFLCFMQVSCMVGPNFHRPALPKVQRYTENPLPTKTVHSSGPGGQSQSFLSNQDIPLLWWELYHSPQINQLIHSGLANSPNLASASAALRRAQENLQAQIGSSLLPAVNLSSSVERQRFSALQIGVPGSSQTFNLYSTSVSASYTLDTFGGARREIESLRAQIDYQQFEWLAAYLTLTTNIVTTAVTVASYQQQIAATLELIKAEQGLLDFFKKQYHLGSASKKDVLTQEISLEQKKASLLSLQNSLSQAKHALSVLVGTFPEGDLPLINLDRLQLPTELPLSLPSNLVRQRPDVLASEALLHAACAQIGVAAANLLPQLTLDASRGWLNVSWAKLFTASNGIWSLSGTVLQPVFRGGALFAQKRAAVAAYEQAAAQYKQTVLQAFQNVADVLSALEVDARILQAQISAEKAARTALNLISNQYRIGGLSYIDLLHAQQQYQQARVNRIQAQAVRYIDTAILFQALGGGWWHKF